MSTGHADILASQRGMRRPWQPILWYMTLAIAATLVLLGRPLIAIAVLGLAIVVTYAHWIFSWSTVLSAVILAVMVVPANLYRLPVSLPLDFEIYRLLVFLLFLMWAVALLTDPSVRLRRTFLDVPLLVVVVAWSLSFMANAGDFEPTLEFSQSGKALFYVLTFVILFYCIVSVVHQNSFAIRLAHLIVYVGAGLAVMAVAERLTGYNIFRHLNEFIPVLKPSYEIDAVLVRGGVRVSGSAAHPIAFGTLLAMVVPLPLEFLLESRERHQQVKWACVAILIIIGALLTVSRTAFIGLTVTLLALAVLHPRHRSVLLLGGLVAGATVHMFFPGVLGRFVASLSPSRLVERELAAGRGGRLADYPLVFSEFLKKPLVGRGIGTFTADRFFFVDNQYLKYLAEIGLFGICAMLYLFITAVARLTRRGRGIGGQQGAIVKATGISVLIYAVVNATFDAQGFPQVVYMAFILMALGVATALNGEGEAALSMTKHSRTGRTA